MNKRHQKRVEKPKKNCRRENSGGQCNCGKEWASALDGLVNKHEWNKTGIQRTDRETCGGVRGARAGRDNVGWNWQSEAASRAARSIGVRKLCGNISFKQSGAL